MLLDGCWIENASYCGWTRQPTKSRLLAVETHDTDSGRLDMAGLTGALAAKLSGLPAEGAACVSRTSAFLTTSGARSPGSSRKSYSSTQGIAGGRAVVVEAQRQKQTAETNGGRRHAAGTQSAGAQPAHNCWRLQRLDVRRWASVWAEGGSDRTMFSPWSAQGKVQDSRSMIGPAGGGPG